MLFHTYAFLIKVFFFSPWKFPVSSLVVFCSVSVACFSAPFNVLTGILLQLKQLYFTCLVLCLYAQFPFRITFNVSFVSNNYNTNFLKEN